jgi:hypothetical protein
MTDDLYHKLGVEEPTLADLSEALRFANSYTRLPILIDAYVRAHFFRGGRRFWFSCLGEEWDGCDNVGHYHNALFAILSEASALMRSAMMTQRERTRWRKLPKIITAYRGCGGHNRLGLSWTLNRTIAKRFPLMHRYRAKRPLLLTARIPKSCIVAVKLGREENELIVLVEERHITTQESLEKRGRRNRQVLAPSNMKPADA